MSHAWRHGVVLSSLGPPLFTHCVADPCPYHARPGPKPVVAMPSGPAGKCAPGRTARR